MDKETAVEIERLKASQEAANKTLDELNMSRKKWDELIRDVAVKIIVWLMLMGGSGIFFGWHMSEEMRRAILNWMSK